MNCSDLKQPVNLTSAFRSEGKTDVDRALHCFHQLFYRTFRALAFVKCSSNEAVRYKAEELVSDAFSRGLASFYFKIKANGFQQGKAGVETVFLSFCLWQLKRVIKDEERNTVRFGGADPSVLLEKKFTDSEMAKKEEIQRIDAKDELLEAALRKLPERCRNLIRWRKLLNLNNEEIAAKTGLKPDTVPHEVYRCMKKLKLLVAELGQHHRT